MILEAPAPKTLDKSLVGADSRLGIALRMLLVLTVLIIGSVVFSDPAAATGNGNNSGAANGSTSTSAVNLIVNRGAVDALHWALRFLDVGVSPNLEQSNNGWFAGQYTMMKAMAVWVMLPLLFIAIIHAIAKGSLNMLLKIAFVYVPISILGSAAAVQMTQLLLDVSDDFSRAFLNSTEKDAGLFFAYIDRGFLQNPVSFWIALILGLALMFTCAMVYIILVLREASIYIATSFLPIGFAMLVWPSTMRFFRKMVEFLLAMIFSKVVMVAGMSLAVASIAGMSGLGAPSSLSLGAGADILAGTPAGDAQGSWTWIGAVIQAIAMFAIIIFSPNLLMRLIGNMAVNADVAAAITDHSNRPGIMNQVLIADRVRGIVGNTNAIKVANGKTKQARAVAHTRSYGDEQLNKLGVTVNRTTGNRHLSVADLDDHMITSAASGGATLRGQLMALSATSNANDQALAGVAVKEKNSLRSIDTAERSFVSEVAAPGGGTMLEKTFVLDVVDAAGNPITHTAATIDRMAQNARKNGFMSVRFAAADRTQEMDESVQNARSRYGMAVGYTDLYTRVGP